MGTEGSCESSDSDWSRHYRLSVDLEREAQLVIPVAGWSQLLLMDSA